MVKFRLKKWLGFDMYATSVMTHKHLQRMKRELKGQRYNVKFPKNKPKPP